MAIRDELYYDSRGEELVFGARKIEGAPRHIAIVPDGNRTWAREQGMDQKEGHMAGYLRLQDIINRATELGIEQLTFWGWSTENWSRSKTEVKYIMKIFLEAAKEMVRYVEDHNVRFVHIGRKDRLPRKIIKLFRELEDMTRDRDGGTFTVALDYGGQDEIVNAVRQMMVDGVSPDEVDAKLMDSYLYTAGLPNPDMVIRTGGRMRLSGILLWQAAYSELFFVDEFFPDFTPERFEELVVEYTHRTRTFGGDKHMQLQPASS